MSSEDETYDNDYEEEEESGSYEEENYEEESENSMLKGHSRPEGDDVLTEDFNHLYETDQTFDSQAAALEWLRQIGLANHMYLVVSTTRTKRLYIKCFRGERYRKHITIEGAKPRKSGGSSRIGCPFQLVVEQNETRLPWRIRTMENRGRHNHELGVSREGYRWPTAIKPHELEMIRADMEIGLKPSQMLGHLQQKPNVNYSKSQHIYNAKAKIKREKMAGVPPLGYLFKLLEDNRWHREHRPIEGTNRIGDIYFGDSRSLSLVNQFSQVLLIDATYNTNIWRLPFVEIIGVVPTGQNFHVAFAFIHDETESSYTWVMEQLKDTLYEAHTERPRIFVTDRELALMNAINKVFPGSPNLLCRRHIVTNVNKELYELSKSRDQEKTLKGWWDPLVYAKTVEEFQNAYLNLAEEFEDVPGFSDYVKDVWLCDADKFVALWIDEFMHYGSVTTNRVESSHAQLKKELSTPQEDFAFVWEAINRVLTKQLNTIKGEFEQARTKVLPFAQNGSVFCRLAGKVAPYAIRLMWNQVRMHSQRVRDYCDCTIVKTHGLLCKCRIDEYDESGEAIDPVDIDVYWRSLYVDGSNRPSRGERRAMAEFLLSEAIEEFIARKPECELRKLAARVRKETYPQFGEYDDPPCVRRKGRPPNASGHRMKSNFEDGYISAKKMAAKVKKKMKGNSNKKKGTRKQTEEIWVEIPLWILRDHIPLWMLSWVFNYHDVIGDGQFGFRCLSWLLFSGNEKRYIEIRVDLQVELMQYLHFWQPYFNVDEPGLFEKTVSALDNHVEGPCGVDHYMQSYEMLQVAATVYQKVIVLYCRSQPMTFLPLRLNGTTVPELPDIWNLGYILEGAGHFIVLDIENDAPRPGLHPRWVDVVNDSLKPWAAKLNILNHQES